MTFQELYNKYSTDYYPIDTYSKFTLSEFIYMYRVMKFNYSEIFGYTYPYCMPTLKSYDQLKSEYTTKCRELKYPILQNIVLTYNQWDTILNILRIQHEKFTRQ